MADIVTAAIQASFVAWGVPTYVRQISPDEGGDGEIATTVEDAPRDVVDALARTFLDQLYAKRGEASPFSFVRRA
jgi:hypothetical protein